MKVDRQQFERCERWVRQRNHRLTISGSFRGYKRSEIYASVARWLVPYASWQIGRPLQGSGGLDCWRSEVGHSNATSHFRWWALDIRKGEVDVVSRGKDSKFLIFAQDAGNNLHVQKTCEIAQNLKYLLPQRLSPLKKNCSLPHQPN